MKVSKSLIGILLALSATFFWSANFVVARGLSSLIPPISLAFYRWFIALIVLLPIAYKTYNKQKHIVKRHWGFFTIAGLLGVTFFNTLIYFAGRTTTATNMSLIAITAPIFIIILSRIFYKEKFPFKSTLGMLLAFIGVIFLITKGNLLILFQFDFSSGDILMLIAATCFASYSVLIKKKPKEVDVVVLLLVTVFIGVVFLLPGYIFEFITKPSIKFSPTIIGSLLYVGIASSIISFYSWNRAIILIGSQAASMIYYFLPVFASVFAIIILKEEIKIYHLFSLLMIVIGIYTASYFKMKNKLI